MLDQPAGLNLFACWIGVVLGVVSGCLLGLGFLKEDWLGGYSSLRRRLYRLAHISFFGLAVLNYLFFATVRHTGLASAEVLLPGLGFLVGAATMPLFCILTAHWQVCRVGFVIPVGSLLMASFLTLQRIWLT